MAALQQQLEIATRIIEQQVDAENERLDRIKDDDEELKKLQAQRLESLKKASKQKQEWIEAGHGKYFEVPDEKEFFAECKKSKNVVCHFYRESTFRCKIVDKHLTLLAPKHMETKFIKIDAERSRFLTDRLKIKVMPTIALIHDSKTKDYIRGFDDLGGVDDFSTDVLEWRIACADVINYSGDITVIPGQQGKKKNTSVMGLGRPQKKTIRDDGNDSSDDDYD